MQNNQDNIQLAFRALADPSRREMLVLLAKDEMTIGELGEHFDFTRAAVKKHLTVLAEGDLISVRAQGRERYNRLKPETLRSTSNWLNYFSQFWDDKLGDLKSAIEKDVQ
ncbi:ArsR/SmtB family transcription factor [Maritalea sp.]|uniref:ArsR/SmtB family transcription factor n=1 Tax=Maritalea sp. TaxID=2003361 RepID=UPI003EF9A2DB